MSPLCTALNWVIYNEINLLSSQVIRRSETVLIKGDTKQSYKLTTKQEAEKTNLRKKGTHTKILKLKREKESLIIQSLK